MESKYLTELIIPSYLVDYKQRLRPAHFMAVAQEAATEGAEQIGMGFDSLASHDLAWVLSRTKLVFNKVPHWKDKVSFSTWHKGVNGLFFIRDYQMKDSEGNVLVNGTSSWITLNTKERTLFPTSDLSKYYDVSAQCSENALEEQAVKVPKLRNAELVATHKVEYSDVDFIGHANNTAYIVWVMDCMPQDLLALYPDVLEINFNKETRAGESVDIYRIVKTDESGATVVLFEGRVGDLPHFTARFTYK